MLLTDQVTLMLYGVAALAGLLVGGVSPSLVISRSVTFALTLLHSLLAGALIGVYLEDVARISVPPVFTAVAFAIAASILTAEAVTRGFPEDVAVALSVAFSTTVTIILTYVVSVSTPTGMAKAMSYVFGTSAIATVGDVIRLGGAFAIIAPLTHLLWYEHKYVSFDPEGAEVMGVRVRAYRYLFYSLIAIASGSLSMSLGVLIAHVAISTPGLVASMKARRMFLTSYTVSLLMFLGGYSIAYIANLPPSAGVGALSVAISAGVMAVMRRA